MTTTIRPRLFSLIFVSLLFFTNAASAQSLKLPSIISDHMVLQAGQPAPIWGWATPGETVRVKFSGQTKRAKAAADGRWSVKLDPLATSSKPATLTIASAETRVINDVIVGEVWLGSGQSNMEKPLGDQRGQLPTLNYKEELALADLPTVRLFKVTRGRSAVALEDAKGEWVVCTPTSLDAIKFSAAAYFFGRKLNRELGVPVGLIQSDWGGTRIEPWTPAKAFNSIPSLSEFAKTAAAARLPALQTATLYNAMIAPLAPYAIKGVIWYQGESNIIEYDDSAVYADKMTALVQGWREAWGQELSFYYVQVAPHLYHVVRPESVVSPEATPRLWEAQTASMRLPRTGMIVTTDLVDDLADIHPRNKKDVGERLARWALSRDYGRQDVVVSGPMFRSMEIRGSEAVLHFDHLGGGLGSRDEKPLNWFIIAGQDGRFYPAKAVIEGDAVVVSSPRVTQPVIVRFAWDEAARPNFVNKAGLPAIPFRTDNPFLAASAR